MGENGKNKQRPVELPYQCCSSTSKFKDDETSTHSSDIQSAVVYCGHQVHREI